MAIAARSVPAPKKRGATKIASSDSLESPIKKVFSSGHFEEARVQNENLSAPNIKKNKVALVPRGAGAGEFENQKRGVRGGTPREENVAPRRFPIINISYLVLVCFQGRINKLSFIDTQHYYLDWENAWPGLFPTW